jgi:hypothetical protein
MRAGQKPSDELKGGEGGGRERAQRWKSQRKKIIRLGYRFAIDFLIHTI